MTPAPLDKGDFRMIEYEVSDNVCVLRLNDPPLNAITFELLEELRLAVEKANADPGCQAIVVTGREDHFSAGADVQIFRDITKAEEAVEASRVFQEVFGEIENSAKPVAAAMAGKIMGGALEFAMACHFRVCDRRATFRMPEVQLGINSGAGGTQRLPRLVGAEAALRMLLTAETVRADRALQMGLVDAVSEPGQLVKTARDLLATQTPPVVTSLRTDKIQDPAANEAAFAEAEKTVAKGRPEIIAPSVILETVRVGLTDSFQAGLRAEQQGFARCMDTLATRNRIYLFFATRKTGKATFLDGAAPAPVKTAAVVGMGTMGTGIAHALTIAGVPVTVVDKDGEILDKGLSRIRKSVEKRVAQGKLAPERAETMLGRLTVSTDWEDLAKADLVIESVFEDLDLKRSVLAQIEKVCPPDTVIATNTSTLSLDALAEGMERGERLVGLHFFNPAHRMPLVEVIRRDSTPADVVLTTVQFAKNIRKTPVLVKNREGFLVNRLFIPYLKEAFHLLEEGADPGAVDRAMVDFGFPIGPITLIDMAGLDILVFTDEVMRGAFDRHGPLSAIVDRLVEQGRLGQKTGAGVYEYEKGDRAARPSETTARIAAEVRKETGRAPREVNEEEITDRLVLRMVNEAFYVLEEGIAERESDVDVAMVLGAGFPDFRGGVLKYARDAGLRKIADDLTALGERYGERYAPCLLLKPYLTRQRKIL